MPLFREESGDATLKLEGFDAADIGAEPAGAETRAKQYTDQKFAEVTAPTLEQLGAEPAGAEARSQNYTDQQISALPPPPTLTQLGGEPIGAEARARSYADQKFAQVPAQIFPTSHIHFWGYAKPPAGKTFFLYTGSAFEFSRIAILSPGTQGDTVEFSFLLEAGNYRLAILHDRFTDRGIASFHINNQLIGNLDFYAAAHTPTVRSYFNFSISSSGRQTIKVIGEGKNASSTAFNLAIIAILINPS